MSTEADPSAFPDLPRRCCDCGYDLTALPPAGKCPECGSDYRADEVVLFGWNEHGNMATATPKAAKHFAIASSILVLIILIHVIRGKWFLVPFLIPIAAAHGYFWYMRHRVLSVAPAPYQLQLSARGVAEGNGLGRLPHPKSWRENAYVEVRQVSDSRVRIYIENGPSAPIELLVDSTLPAKEWATRLNDLIGRGNTP